MFTGDFLRGNLRQKSSEAGCLFTTVPFALRLQSRAKDFFCYLIINGSNINLLRYTVLILIMVPIVIEICSTFEPKRTSAQVHRCTLFRLALAHSALIESCLDVALPLSLFQNQFVSCVKSGIILDLLSRFLRQQRSGPV